MKMSADMVEISCGSQGPVHPRWSGRCPQGSTAAFSILPTSAAMRASQQQPSARTTPNRRPRRRRQDR